MEKNVTTEEFEQALSQMAEGFGLSVKELASQYLTKSEIDGKLSALDAKLDSVVDLEGADTAKLTEQYKAVKGTLESLMDAGEDANQISELLAQIVSNAGEVAKNTELVKALSAEFAAQKASAEKEIAELQAKVSATSTSLSDLVKSATATKAAQVEINKQTNERVSGVETGLQALSGGIDQALTDEKARVNAVIEEAKTSAIETANADAEAKIAGVEKQLADLSSVNAADVEALKGQLAELQTELTDSLDGEQNLVKGLKARLADAEAAISIEIAGREEAIAKAVADAKAHTDATAVQSKNLDTNSVINKFRFGLGLSALSDGSENDTTSDDTASSNEDTTSSTDGDAATV